MTRIPADRALWLGKYILPHEAALRAWLRSKPRGTLEVDDIVQETYAILVSRESVDEIQNPKNYAFQVAFSIIQTHLRRLRIVSFESLGDVDTSQFTSDLPTPEREAADRENLRIIGACISALPKKCREVIVLRRIHGLSHREIAAQLRISERAVEKLVSKALRLLAESLEGRNVDPQSSNKGGGEVVVKASEK
jgi:RNA polymerase sigma factor (sigma-70 family)